MSSTERWGHLRARFGASSASPAALSYSSNDAQARGLSRIPKPVCQTPSSAVSCLTCGMARSLLRGDPVVQVVSNWTGWSETSTPAVTQWPLSQALHSNRNADSDGLPCQCVALAAVCLLAPCMHAMTIVMHHHVAQQLIRHRSSRQHLVLHMQGRPKQLKTVEAVRSPLSMVNSHNSWTPASRIPQPSPQACTGVLTPEHLVANKVQPSLQQLCLLLCGLLSSSVSLQLQTPSSLLHVARHAVCPSCQHSACCTPAASCTSSQPLSLRRAGAQG